MFFVVIFYVLQNMLFYFISSIEQNVLLNCVINKCFRKVCCVLRDCLLALSIENVLLSEYRGKSPGGLFTPNGLSRPVGVLPQHDVQSGDNYP